MLLIPAIALFTPSTYASTPVFKLLTLPESSLRDVQAQHQKFAEDAVKPLWEAKGFSALRRNAIGNQRSLYSNMIRRNSDGTINSDMLFQNPYDNSTPLTNEEREFLKKALWEINKWRFNLKGKSINSPEVQQYIKQEKWYWIPLQKSDNLLAQSISELGFSKYIQQKYNNYITEFKSNFAISEHGFFSILYHLSICVFST